MKALKMLLFVVCVFVALAGSSTGQNAAMPKGNARVWVRAAMDAMGGEPKLRAIQRVRMEMMGHWHMVEQSERPEWPWLVAYENTVEVQDFERRALWQQSEGRSMASPDTTKIVMTVANGVSQMEVAGQKRAFGVAQVEDAEEWLATSPSRILLLASEANDLTAEGDRSYHDVPHHVVRFHWKPSPDSPAVPVRVLLNAWTKLPSAVEWVRAHPNDTFWRVWGDFPQRMVYTMWSLQAGGVRYPLQWDLERDGKPYHMRTIFKLEINPTLEPAMFTIADEVKKQFEERKAMSADGPPLGKPTPIIEGNDDLVEFVGAWNSTLINQPDGVVVLESPISAGFSRKVMDEAKKRYPGVPVKAVITTSDAYPHFAGIREYVASGVPVFATDLNKGTLTKAVNAPHTQAPDALAKNPRPAHFTWVSGKTAIGTGKNRIELYPIRNASGERMMMVYFPEYKLLYASDLVQRMKDGSFFFPEYLREVSDAVSREKLAVDKVFAMHSTVIPWSEVMSGIAKAEK